LNASTKRSSGRSDVVGIYPNDQALIRLAGMLLVEQNDEWLVQRRYLSEHSIRQVLSEAEQNQEVMTTQNKEAIELNAA
jgi:hypothetical protein